MIGIRRGRTGSRSATLGLAAAATIAAVGAAPGDVQGQDIHEVTVRAEPAGWIGVSIDVPVRADGFLATPDGLLVSRVMEASPADRARLRPGDRIVRVNGLAATVERFKEMAGNLRPGDRIQLTYEADGSRNTVTITAAERPESPLDLLPREMVVRISSKVDSLRWYAVRGTARGAAIPESEPEPVRILLGGEEITTWFESIQNPDSMRNRRFDVRVDGSEPPPPFVRMFGSHGAGGTTTDGSTVRIRGVRNVDHDEEAGSAPSVFSLVEQRDLVAGARLTRLGAELASYFEVEGGLLVTEIIEGTPSTEAGLRPGDALIEVDGRRLEEIEQFRRAWATASHQNRTLSLTLVRHGERMELRLPG